jgi:hypothetical protein
MRKLENHIMRALSRQMPTPPARKVVAVVAVEAAGRANYLGADKPGKRVLAEP